MTRTPPHDTGAERSVLGACMLNAEAAATAMAMLAPESFYRPAHGTIFSAMLALAEGSDPIDFATVRHELRNAGFLENAGGTGYITELTDDTPTAANVEHYARVVSDHARRRAIITHGNAIAESGYDTARPPDEIEDEAAAALTGATDRRTTGPTMAKDLAHAEVADAKLRAKRGGPLGIRTGLRSVDKWIGSLRPGSLVILAGRPSMGKTALAINMTSHAILEEKVPTLVMSYEMSKGALFQRLICAHAQLGSSDLDRMRLDFEQEQRYHRSVAEYAAAPLAIDESQPGIMGLRSIARRHKQRHGLGLLVVDYIQRMEGDGSRSGNREGDISEISRKLKGIASELSIPVVALSQLNRGVETRPDKLPRLSDLRESGAIEQDADVVGLLYREHYYNKKADEAAAQLIIAKQRNGPTGTVHLRWSARHCLFEDA